MSKTICDVCRRAVCDAVACAREHARATEKERKERVKLEKLMVASGGWQRDGKSQWMQRVYTKADRILKRKGDSR